MPSPSSSLATLRPDLGGSFMEFDLEMGRRGFIASEVFTIFDAAKASGTFGKIPLEQLLQKRETLRAPGGGYNRGRFTFTTASFACQEHGVEEPVDEREAAMYAEYFDAEQVAAMRAYDAVLRNAEQRVADAVFNTTTWTGSGLTTGITNEWDDAANATPIADVKAAKHAVWDGSGLWPNALIINRLVFNHLREVDEIVDRIKYQGFQDARSGAITAASLALVFDLDFVLVAGSPKNTADAGLAASISPIWSNEYAMVCKVATSQDIREPCIGRTIHYAEDGSQPGGTIETYRDEKVRSDIVRVRHDVDELTLYAEAGHLLSNITT